MAMSIQACLPNSCKNQHSMKAMSKSPNFLRRGSSMRQNAANRRSAVERLEESKANYVKSERVLDTKQEFKHSSHLRVSTGPQLDLLFKAPPRYCQDASKSPTSFSVDLKFQGFKAPIHHHHHQNVLPPKSPAPVRARAKSHSEVRETHINRKLSFASRSSRYEPADLVDIESQLKRLISSTSKENVTIAAEEMFFGACQASETLPKSYKVTSEIPKVRRGYSDPVSKGSWLPSENSPEKNYSIHKSMPDLSPSPGGISPTETMSSEESEDSIFQQNIPLRDRHLPSTSKVLINNQYLRKDENEDGFFASYKEPRRFSNGTGALHLTPCYMETNQYQRRPVSRSKSDVTYRYSKRNSEYIQRRGNYTSAEIERFFDMMGLDTTVWHHIASPSLASSPPCFFESVSSIDSNDDRSSVCSEDSLPETPREGLRNQDLQIHGPLETSIVEKNARVIKWLYNCRKALRES